MRKQLHSAWNRVKKKNHETHEGSPRFWVFGCFMGYTVLWLLCHHYYLLFADHALDS